ncbi:type IV toxin-antitoxin system AbiEi family antitoxin domain-containing protein [Pseudactinotalea sp. HY158]|uniref:type IV toxin-antitoxin system AbiEi family antitoxin domain-containing protein n=1 Tax=Pseudactinotalea sp. HY158 TaxID=2654547 RepID=UPI00129C95B0|nr:type IV toxin-antitoxin system AbiEi family antitoxin domain-containing protein [Pseudactinotalea sp. HY158]QGH70828.1 hypothetical protein GCE65_16010 [Pseudactinotalea sp. HY158]
MTNTVPPEVFLLACSQANLVSTRQLRAHGVSEQHVATRVRRRDWIRVTNGVYDLRCSPVEPHDHDHRRRRAAWIGLLSHPLAVAVGNCALMLHGIEGLPRRIEPEIILPAGHTTGSAGVRVRQFRRPGNVVKFRGQWIAEPITALVQALPELPRANALAVLDSALHREIITSTDLARIERLLTGRRGVRALRPLLGLADGRAESPMESTARLASIDAGLPRPLVQLRLHDESGRLIARGDLGWAKRTSGYVLTEIDSREFHDTAEALFYDRARQNAIVLSGDHTPLRFLARDVYDGTFVRDVRRALIR